MSSRENQKKKSKNRYPDQLVKELLGNAKWKASKQQNTKKDDLESDDWDSIEDQQSHPKSNYPAQDEHIYYNYSHAVKNEPIYYNSNYPMVPVSGKKKENTYAVPGKTMSISPYNDHWKARSRNPSPLSEQGSPYYSPVDPKGSPYETSFHRDITGLPKTADRKFSFQPNSPRLSDQHTSDYKSPRPSDYKYASGQKSPRPSDYKYASGQKSPTPADYKYASVQKSPRPSDHKYASGRKSPRPSDYKYASGRNSPRSFSNKYSSGRNSPRLFDSKNSSGRNSPTRAYGSKHFSGRNSPKVTYHTEFHVSDAERFDAEAVKRQLQLEKMKETYQNYTVKKKYNQSISEEIQFLCEEIQKSQDYWYSVITSLHQYQQRCYSMQDTLAQTEASISRVNVDDRKGSSPTSIRKLQETLQDLHVTMQQEIDKTDEDREKFLESSSQAERTLEQYDEICEIFHKMDQEKEKKIKKLEDKIAGHAVEVTRMEKVIEAKDKDLKLYRQYAHQHKEEDETYQILKMQVQTYQEDFQAEKELSQKLANQNEQLMRSLRDEEVINRELTSQLQSLLNSKSAIPSSQVLPQASRNSAFRSQDVDIDELNGGGIKCRKCRTWLPSAAAYEVHVKQNCLKKSHKGKGMSYRLSKPK